MPDLLKTTLKWRLLASEEMKLQATQTQGFVNRLVVLVRGKVNSEDGQPWDGGKDKAAVSRKTGQCARGLTRDKRAPARNMARRVGRAV